MSVSPLVSVIIPVYNGAKFLSEAVESIRAQNYQTLEIIIVDDGSTDETAEIAASLGQDIRYVYQSNRGPAAARNTGLAIAQGDVIAFLDADDYWPQDKLHIQLTHLMKDPKLGVVLGRVQLTGTLAPEDHQIRFEGPDNTIAYVNLGCGIYRRSVFDKVGVFDETLRHYEDHDWFLRAREQGVSMLILGYITLHYRRHEHSMSRQKRRETPSLIQVLKKSLDRRRQQHAGAVPILPKFHDFDEKRVCGKPDDDEIAHNQLEV